MKKFLMAICALAVATTVASAAIGVSWTTVNWGENHLGDGSGSGNAILDANSILWQLIYAGADNAINTIPTGTVPTAGGPGIADNYVLGDDVVWAERTLSQTLTTSTAPEDGTTWDNWLSYQSGSTLYTDLAWSTAGFVYQRIFESTTPGDGTYYFESGLTALITNYDAGAPATQTISNPDAAAPFVSNQQIVAVPEPATMGLLGLGALVMAIRRRRA